VEIRRNSQPQKNAPVWCERDGLALATTLRQHIAPFAAGRAARFRASPALDPPLGAVRTGSRRRWTWPMIRESVRKGLKTSC